MMWPSLFWLCLALPVVLAWCASATDASPWISWEHRNVEENATAMGSVTAAGTAAVKRAGHLQTA